MTTLARWARAEWGPLYAAVRGPLRARRPRAVPMAVAAVCLTAVLHFVHNQSWGYRFVQNVGAVRAEDPLWLALLRTPLSLFVPALDLPVWGALAQILLVFGIAELCLGWWRALPSRMSRRSRAPCTRAWASFWDRTPRSACPPRTPGSWTPGRRRRWWACPFPGLALPRLRHGLVVFAAMVVEVALKENLAGKEHLAAIAAVLVLCAAGAARQRRSRDRAGSESGAPPIQS